MAKFRSPALASGRNFTNSWCDPETASMRPALVGGRQERGVENVVRLGLGLEGVHQPDLIDRFCEPHEVDGAVAVGFHLRRDDVVADGHAYPPELDLLFQGLVAP